LVTLTSDLSVLGEELAKRFELEDKVIALVSQAISSSDEN